MTGSTPNKHNPVFSYSLIVSQDAIDKNGHVNNVHYVQWMQDAATRHYDSQGGIPITQTLGATWVVRAHTIEYLRPAFVGDEIEIRTWVANFRRVRSLRRYEFIRKQDGVQLAKGETDWVFVDAKTGRPMAIPDEIVNLLPLLTE